MRISDWSSDVCSSDLHRRARGGARRRHGEPFFERRGQQDGIPRCSRWRSVGRRSVKCAADGNFACALVLSQMVAPIQSLDQSFLLRFLFLSVSPLSSGAHYILSSLLSLLSFSFFLPSF